MNLLLEFSKIYIPTFIKKAKLTDLFDCTARAFGCATPSLKGLTYQNCLTRYALFTKENAEKAIQYGYDLQKIKEQLYHNAYQLGQKIRKDFHINTIYDIMDMSRILYRVIDIDFQEDTSGEVTINRCFFSKYYSSQVCQVISSMDEGVLAGLSQGRKLEFYQRITEGQACCKAHFGESFS